MPPKVEPTEGELEDFKFPTGLQSFGMATPMFMSTEDPRLHVGQPVGYGSGHAIPLSAKPPGTPLIPIELDEEIESVGEDDDRQAVDVIDDYDNIDPDVSSRWMQLNGTMDGIVPRMDELVHLGPAQLAVRLSWGCLPDVSSTCPR